MDCEKFRLELVNLFDSNIDEASLKALLDHLLQCPACATDYRETEEVLSMLKPKHLPDTPFLLKQNIIHQLNMEESKMKNATSKPVKISVKVKRILSVAALLAVIMLIVPFVGKNDGFMNSTAKAANNFIESSINATRLIKTMVIKLKVRTIASDNFSLVGTNYDMVEHTIWATFGEPEKWRVDKGERVVVFDGKNQYLWKPKFNEGIKAGPNANFVEWFKILLNPESVLMKEQQATKVKGSKLTMEEKDGELHMTITSSAQGNFINDYGKNSSIAESDNRREYTFDSDTKLIKGLKIYILNGNEETLILEIEKIDYNVPVDPSLFVINLPKGVEWTNFTDEQNTGTLTDIGSKNTAKLFFESMAKNDWKPVEEICPFFRNKNNEKVKKVKEYFGGLKVISIGEPFKSGLYAGEFVPYEIEFKSGETKKFNLAVRNDNPNKIWMVDGGF